MHHDVNSKAPIHKARYQSALHLHLPPHAPRCGSPQARTINTSQMWGINSIAFNVDSATNRLLAPNGTLSYDAAGTLIHDSYTVSHRQHGVALALLLLQPVHQRRR
jgi:hypothetical protein